MRIFSNYKNMTTFEKLPEWVEVDSKWVIQCTREALNKLGDWCRKNAGSLAISVFATVGVNVALAQTTPTSPSASAIAPTDKGGWQVVRIDGKEMTFAEIAALPKEQKWPILKKLGELDQLWIYQEWRNSLSEAANQRVDTKKWVEQAANQEWKNLDKQLIKIDEALKPQIQDIQKINGVPKPTSEELQKWAQDIPELKWATSEEIQSGKYDNILLADYYVRNATVIGKNLNTEDSKKFQASINSLSDTLGRRRIENFDTLAQSLVLGEGRSRVESRGRELIEKWYSREVIWNAGDRTITFSNDKWETRTIETARVPPRESITIAGLSIDRDIPRVDPEVVEKRRLIDIQWEKRRIVTTDYENLSLIDTQNLPKEMREAWDRHARNQTDFDRATTATDRLTVLENLKMSNMDIESARRAMMTPENMDLIWSYEPSIAREKMQIEKLISSLRIYIDWEWKLIKYRDIWLSSTDTFDSIARSNLAWLTDDSSLFQNMWPRADEALYRILDETNKNRDPKNQINIAEKPLDAIERTTLLDIYDTLIKNLGYTRSILTQVGISEFQDKINTAVTKLRWSPWSIEDLIKATPEPS